VCERPVPRFGCGATARNINARDLVGLLAKAGRPRHIETDVVEDNAGESLAHEARGTRLRLDANSASTLPSQKIGQGRSASTPSPQPSPVRTSRGPKRHEIDERDSVGVNCPPHTEEAAHPAWPSPPFVIRYEAIRGSFCAAYRLCFHLGHGTSVK
jgi:hypothetical protein